MTFAESAARLAGLAAGALGWRPGEFWAATPAELVLSLGGEQPTELPPSRGEILMMIEREAHYGRSH